SELDDLVTAATNERADALGEIMAQSDEFLSYFMGLLGVTPTSHPRTCRLLYIASLTGLFVVMYFKNMYQRPRPSLLCPGLLPPIQVPGHASYPSGHSTQAHLIAECVKLVLPSSVKPALSYDLDQLAQRIARNREIAGLHYKSDSDAG